jgi:hypothetical protein
MRRTQCLEEESTPVAIVKEAFVRRHFQGRDPIGARLVINWTGRPIVREIVGVARQVKARPEETESSSSRTCRRDRMPG